MSTPTGPAPKGDQTPKLLATTIIFDVLAVIIVLLRFVSRRMAHANLWWDDWFMLPAMVGLGFRKPSSEATHFQRNIQVMFIASIVVDGGGMEFATV